MTNLTQIILSENFKELSKPILRQFLKDISKIISFIKSDFQIEGQEITFLCPENSQKFDIVFRTKGRYSLTYHSELQ